MCPVPTIVISYVLNISSKIPSQKKYIAIGYGAIKTNLLLLMCPVPTVVTNYAVSEG